jgi:hypothetical protein
MAGGKSLDPLFEKSDKLFQTIKDDPRISSLFEDLDEFVDRLLFEEDYVTTSKASRRAQDLYDRAQKLVKEDSAWKATAQEFVDELRDYLKAIENDKTTRRLGDAFEKLGEDIARLGKTGFGALKSEADNIWKDVFNVILPRLIDSIKDIPLPR